MGRENTEEREFVRVETQLPLHYRQLSPGEYRREKARILLDRQARINSLFQLVERWSSQDEQGMRGGESERLIIPILAAMNEKLDRILSLIDPSDPLALRFKEPHSLNIRGAGMGLVAKECFPLETTLALELVLPFPFPLTIKAIGKVNRVESLDGENQQWDIGMKFDVIHEEDREAIIRYIFREQRIALRARSLPMLFTKAEQSVAPENTWR
jgi:PilZ domain